MQVSPSQIDTVMLHQNLAASAHQAILDQRPDLAEAEGTKPSPHAHASAKNPTNSFDILV